MLTSDYRYSLLEEDELEEAEGIVKAEEEEEEKEEEVTL